MATVGITKELRNRVASVINRMRKAEIATDVPGFDKNHIIDASLIFHTGCWGAEHIHLIDKIPKEWLAKVTASDVKIIGGEYNTTIRFDGLTAYARPADSYWNRSSSEVHIEAIEAMPSDTPGRAQCIERWRDAATVREIDARWAKIEKDIDDFLSKCKTLNEAVKLFPAIKMYIDPDDIRRLETKVERMSQRKKIVEAVDTDTLTAAAMAAKLAGAV